MKTREDDIIELCKQIVNLNTVYSYLDTMQGGDIYTCPICGTEDTNNKKQLRMKDLSHEMDCGYLIAKDLLVNIK